MAGAEPRGGAALDRDRMTPAPPRRRRAWVWWLLLVLLAAGGGWWWLNRGGAQAPRPAAAAAMPVTVAAAARQDVPLTVDALGTVAATNSITVKSQIDGTLTEIAFTEGQEVKAGDILARIDDRSYRAALDSAQGKLAYDQAQLANAQLDLRRYQGLLRNQGVTQQQVDTQRAQVAMYEAQIRQDQASVDSARVDLDHTVIRAPIDGRIGIRGVDAGNLVRSSDTTGIVTISQLRPIVVTFALPQQDLARLKSAMAAGAVPVETIPDQATPGAHRGTISTIDNSVDSTTGTIKVKSSFPNADSALWPGAFVNVRIQLELRRGTLAVPLVAVQRGPDSAFVFVVTAEEKVEKRVVRIEVQTADLALVAEGLREGEKVVTSGALRLTPGAQVRVATP